MDDESAYVSDAQREAAVLELREDLVCGRLTLEEFSERVERAYTARTDTALQGVRDRLPERPLADHKPRRISGALFGRAIRHGRMRIRRRTRVVSVAADVDLDLRQARIDSDRVTITVCALFGNVDIYIPEGIDVTVGGSIVAGRYRDWGDDTPRPDVPAVHVRIVGVLGTVDVWRVPRDVAGDYGAIQRELQQRQTREPA